MAYICRSEACPEKTYEHYHPNLVYTIPSQRSACLHIWTEIPFEYAYFCERCLIVVKRDENNKLVKRKK